MVLDTVGSGPAVALTRNLLSVIIVKLNAIELKELKESCSRDCALLVC